MNVPAILDASGNPLPRSRQNHMLRAFTASSTSHPDLARWLPRNYAPAEAMHWDREMMVSRVHDLIRNDGWASAALSRQVDSAIGSGWNLSAKPIASRLGVTQEVADELATQIEDAFIEWASDPRFYCDAQRRMPLGTIVAMAFRHRLADGEAFAVLHWEKKQPISTCIEVVHPDRCRTPPGYREGDGIRSGVELGKRGAPIAYHFMKTHPGEMGWGFGVNQSVRVARETSFGRPVVVHAFEPTEAGQVRGVPILAPVVHKLRMLGRYDESELQAAVLNAVLAAFITSPFDHEQVANAVGGRLEDTQLSAFQDMRTSIYGDTPIAVDGVRVNFLAPGDKAEFLDAKHPNSVFEQFQRASLRNIASAAGVSYEQLSMDWGQVNYSSARAALIEVWRGLTARRDIFASSFMQPIYGAWLEEALDKGVVVAPKGARDFSEAVGAWTQAEWIGPGRGWVDPLKEANAAVVRISSGVSNYKRECAEQGIDYRENFRQIARERRELETAGLKFTMAGILMPPEAEEQPAAAKQAASA